MTAPAPRPHEQRGDPEESREAVLTDPVPADEAEAVSAVDGGEPVGIPSLAGVLTGIGSSLTAGTGSRVLCPGPDAAAITDH